MTAAQKVSGRLLHKPRWPHRDDVALYKHGKQVELRGHLKISSRRGAPLTLRVAPQEDRESAMLLLTTRRRAIKALRTNSTLNLAMN